MFKTENTKFQELTCAYCSAPIPIGMKCYAQVDVSGWLLYAVHLGCKEENNNVGSSKVVQ